MQRAAAMPPLLAHARATQSRILAAHDASSVLAVVEDTLQLGCVHAATALRRLAVLKKRGAHIPYGDARYARLERLLECDVANRLDARGLSAAAWAAAVLQRPALLDGMLQHSAERLREATLQEHAVVAWSLGRLRLGRKHAATLTNVSNACTVLLRDFSPVRLALRLLHDLAQPASRTREHDTDALRVLSTVNPQSMTRLLCGFAACGHAPPQRLVDALGQVAARQLPLFNGSQLAFLIAAHAQLGQLPSTQLLLAAPRALEASLPTAGPLAASLALWAFARLRLHPGPSFLQTCDATLAQAGVRSVSTARLAGVVWACGALGWRPAASWPLLIEALASRELRPEDRHTLLVGLSRLQCGTGVKDADNVLQLAAVPDQADTQAVRSVWLACRPLPGA